ncbi:MAG TPA: SRPBCC domain-containing protein [Flavisolibacter sp.]|nr:SRPBCC domain-containing protein [Flavisolibacter sp.]
MEKDLKFEFLVDAPVSEVWKAWLNPNVISTWLANEANIEPRQGGLYELFWDPSNKEVNSTIGCRIIELIPYELLYIEWKGPADFMDLMNEPASMTRVTIRFQAVDGKTRVSLIHSGWGDSPRWENAKKWHTMAWSMGLKRLGEMFEK